MEVSFVSGSETLQATLYGEIPATSLAGVVLCPPHPLHDGNRHDTRIVTVARELSKHGFLALCMDYGSYGGCIREVQHVLDAAAFMRGKGISSLGLLGYSFGAVVASNAAATVDRGVSSRQSSALNSSVVNPAWRRIEWSVPRASSRWRGTMTVLRSACRSLM